MYDICIFIVSTYNNSLSMMVWPYAIWVHHPALDHGTHAKIMPEWISQQNFNQERFDLHNMSTHRQGDGSLDTSLSQNKS